jgi:N-acetyl-gamma-glutamyl-phosphate reductase
MKPTVFIDGEAGTTGLEIHSRLINRKDIKLLSIEETKRKDPRERARRLNEVDLAILCLPDEAAREAVSLVENPDVKLLDASSAHRTSNGWVYGFPELAREQRQKIATAKRVSNPGCYPTGFIACIRPVVESGIIPPTFPITVNAVSGYSGGGKGLIEVYQDAPSVDGEVAYPYGIYGLNFSHKHVEEMRSYSGLTNPPLFVPAVGHFERGMLTQIPLPLWALPGSPKGKDIHSVLTEYYHGEDYVVVMPFADTKYLRDSKFLDPREANGTNIVQLFVFANDNTKEALLVARLDNLGKGASSAAVQNMNIMLGLPEQDFVQSSSQVVSLQ